MLRLHALAPHTVQRPCGVRQMGRTFTLQIRQQHHAVRTGRRLQRLFGQPRQIRAEHLRRTAQHPHRIGRVHHGQMPPGGVRERGDRPGGVRQRLVMDPEDGPRGAERHHRVALHGAQPEGGRHRLARTGRDQQPLRREPGRPGRPQHLRQPHLMAQRQLDQIRPVGAGRRRPETRRRGPAPVRRTSRGPPQQLPGQPVVRLHDLRDPRRVVRFRTGQPAQLGHRMRRLRHRPDGLRPCAAPAERVHQVRGRGLRPLVVADQRGPYEIPLRIQRHQPVLLRGNPDRLDALQQPASRGLAQRHQPRLRIGLRTLLDGVWCIPLPDDGTRVRIADHDPCACGRTVQSGDYPHGPRFCPMGRWGA